MDIHRTANMRSWFDMLFDQPDLSVGTGRDCSNDGDDDDDDDSGTDGKR